MIKQHENNQVMTVTLNRPEVRNSFHPQMIAEIAKVFRDLSARTDLRAVVLRGEGKVFCAGADLNWMKEMVNYSLEENKKDSAQLFEMFAAVHACPFPMICAVQGAAFGGALGFLAAADYVIVEDKAQLCFSEVKLGIAPAVISTFILKKVALGVVSPLMLSGKVFSPRDVLGSGLVHEVTTAADMDTRVNAAVKMFLEVGPEAVRATKQLLQKMKTLSDGQAAIETAKVIAERRVSAEGQEGLQSFLEKRTPRWRKISGSDE
jgi:methylglutaconyl-CoA hydratase